MPRSIAQQLQDVIDNRRQVSRAAFASACIQLGTSGIIKTPVDEGRARGSWNSTIDDPDTSTDEKRTEDQAMAQLRSTTNQLQLGQTFYFVSGLPYIRKLEYGEYGDGPKTTGGYSKQAPQGMVRITADEFRQAVRAALRREQ